MRPHYVKTSAPATTRRVVDDAADDGKKRKATTRRTVDGHGQSATLAERAHCGEDYDGYSRPKRLRHNGKAPFTNDRARLARGAAPECVSRDVCGPSVTGVGWQWAIDHVATHGNTSTGQLSPHSLRKATSKCARRIMRTVLLLLDGLEPDGDKLPSVRGSKAYWGRQHRFVELTEREREARRAEGKSDGPTVREYVPFGQQGGLSARVVVSVRQLGRYAKLLRAVGLFDCHQPPRNSKDAVLPRKGAAEFPYPIWRIGTLQCLPEPVWVRLRRYWGLKRTNGRNRPRAAAAVVQTCAVTLPDATGPPDTAAVIGDALQDVHADPDRADLATLAVLKAQLQSGTRPWDR